MANYTKITDYAAKDALLTGNTAKLVKGTEIGAEFDAIATAVATKFDSGGASTGVAFTQSGTGAAATTVQVKLRQTMSVKDFGATGNGVTDDTLTVQAAITACANRRLFFPAGTYLVSTLTGVSGIHMYGEGAEVSKIVSDGTDVPSFIDFTTKTNFEISDLTIDFGDITSTPATSALGLLDCDYFSVHDCYITKFDKIAIGLNACNYWWIENNIISRTTADTQGVNQAVLVTESAYGASTHGWIRNNRCLNAGMILTASYVTIDGNHIADWKYGAGVALGATATTIYNTVTNNIIENSYTGLDSDGLSLKGIECFGAHTYIGGNIIRSCSGPGIFAVGPYPVIIGNTCRNNGTYAAENSGGIVVGYSDATYNGYNAVVKGNICFDTAGAGGTQDYGLIVASGVSNVVVEGNNLIGNKTGEASILATDTSYWGRCYEGESAATTTTVNAGTTNVSIAITVAGAALGDFVSVSCDQTMNGCFATGYVHSANTVYITITNPTGGNITFTDAVWRASVMTARP